MDFSEVAVFSGLPLKENYRLSDNWRRVEFVTFDVRFLISDVLMKASRR